MMERLHVSEHIRIIRMVETQSWTQIFHGWCFCWFVCFVWEPQKKYIFPWILTFIQNVFQFRLGIIWFYSSREFHFYGKIMSWLKRVQVNHSFNYQEVWFFYKAATSLFSWPKIKMTKFPQSVGWEKNQKWVKVLHSDCNILLVLVEKKTHRFQNWIVSPWFIAY